MRQYTVEELRVKAASYCAADEHCRHDVVSKLLSWGADADDADVIVEALEADGFIDDARYARMYCESKVRHQRWGRVKIAFQLRGKGMSQDVVSQALATVDEELYMTVAVSLAQSKWDALCGDEMLRKQKVSAYLLSRGFEYDVISQAIENVSK